MKIFQISILLVKLSDTQTKDGHTVARQIDGQTDEWMGSVWNDVQIDEWMDGKIDESMDRCLYIWFGLVWSGVWYGWYGWFVQLEIMLVNKILDQNKLINDITENVSM